MKTRLSAGIISCLLVMSAMISCSDDDDDSDKVSIVRMTVAPEVVERGGMHSVSSQPSSRCSEIPQSEYLKVKIGDSGEWFNISFGIIQGFYYQDGYEYVLEVKMTEPAIPTTCGTPTRYELIKEIAKNKVNTDIESVERFWVTRNDHKVKGNNLTVGEKDEIEAAIINNYYSTFKTYKFVYNQKSKAAGKVIIYVDNRKQEGTFERITEQDDKVYKVKMEQKEYTLYLKAPGIRIDYQPNMLFVQDITEVFKAGYPNLEQALFEERLYKIN